MMTEKSDKLLKLANASGFLFQLRIEDEIEKTKEIHRKEVIASEYRWLDPKTGLEGFIDIILSTGTNRKMIIECKRVRQADWLFLVPETDEIQARANILWTSNRKSKKSNI